MTSATRQDRWRRATEWPLTAAAVLFLAVYAWDVLADLDPPDDVVPQTISWIIWAMFLVDYVVRLALADQRGRWFLHHLLEFLVVVLPLLRPLRLLRLIPLLTALHRTAGETLRGRVVVYTVGSSALLILISSLAVLDVERDAPDALITNFGDALWWSMVTITSVGYGDVYPVTDEGRLIAAAVMIAGLAVLGSVTATLASLLLSEISTDEKETRAATRSDLDTLTKEVTRLQGMIEDSAGTTDPAAGSSSSGDSARRDPPDPHRS
jgi:voltage-gated potassium channel